MNLLILTYKIMELSVLHADILFSYPYRESNGAARYPGSGLEQKQQVARKALA